MCFSLMLCIWAPLAPCNPTVPLACASPLQVLNLGRNKLAGKVAVGRLRALKALILNENELTLVGGEACLFAWPRGRFSCMQPSRPLSRLLWVVHPQQYMPAAPGWRARQLVTHLHCHILPSLPCLPPGLDKCRELNTLVLSHNSVASLGSWASGLPKLEKLSISYNALAELGGSLK